MTCFYTYQIYDLVFYIIVSRLTTKGRRRVFIPGRQILSITAGGGGGVKIKPNLTQNKDIFYDVSNDS